MEQPTDRNGKQLTIGARVRLLHLSGNWLDELPPEEAKDVNSMIGEVFEIEEIDEYGRCGLVNRGQTRLKAHVIRIQLHWTRTKLSLLKKLNNRLFRVVKRQQNNQHSK